MERYMTKTIIVNQGIFKRFETATPWLNLLLQPQLTLSRQRR
jgi:hypothetical protein